MRTYGALIGVMLAAAAATAAEPIYGRARVIDGDTLEVAGVRVRLEGVAAPELSEAGGDAARVFLERLVEGRVVVCAPTGRRSRGRRVAVCRLDGRDLGEMVIAAGLARDCPRYSRGRYAAVEREAAAGLPFPGYCQPRR